MQPLVVTLELDERSQQALDALRSRHFPPHRLVVGAHVTLFHALPGDQEAEVREALDVAADREAFDVHVTGVRFLGGGVAYDLSVDPSVRQGVAARFALSRQDAQPWKPHVTVQNKVPAEQARLLHQALAEAFVPWTARAEGLALWRYAGGPWEPLGSYPFRSRQE
ncbi:MAG: 2'-5' RNA ligase family protein [Actinobacteria bacterium]|nr:2'-5' RNA ligase family protein [Actinomycetota bacterium]MCA1722168.1 2'-5' RNA ligase family protein [Actinomycetota bacterium]